jgi:hypothetical protein
LFPSTPANCSNSSLDNHNKHNNQAALGPEAADLNSEKNIGCVHPCHHCLDILQQHLERPDTMAVDPPKTPTEQISGSSTIYGQQQQQASSSSSGYYAGGNTTPHRDSIASRRDSTAMPPPPLPLGMPASSPSSSQHPPPAVAASSPSPGLPGGGARRGSADGLGLPVRHPRPLTAAEIHMEFEKEQEAVVCSIPSPVFHIHTSHLRNPDIVAIGNARISILFRLT